MIEKKLSAALAKSINSIDGYVFLWIIIHSDSERMSNPRQQPTKASLKVVYTDHGIWGWEKKALLTNWWVTDWQVKYKNWDCILYFIFRNMKLHYLFIKLSCSDPTISYRPDLQLGIWGFFIPCPLYFSPYSLVHGLFFFHLKFLLFLIRKCSGQHSCIVSSFINRHTVWNLLNSLCKNLWKRSAVKAVGV